MRIYISAGIALVSVLGSSAFAADMPTKAPPPAGCANCNWNGFYVGVNVGGGIGHDPSEDSISLNPAGGFGNAVAPGVGNPISYTSYNSSPAGLLGGGQLGFNWQTGNLVLGAEGDWDWASQRNSLQVSNYIASGSFVAPGAYNYSNEEKIKWLATLRGRVGWATGYTLAYVTGGAAWGGIDSNYMYQATGNLVFASPAAPASFSTVKGGWVLGSGVETSLGWMGTNNWSAKVEYLYVDLGTVSNNFTVPVAQTALPPGGSAYTISSSTHIRDHIVRAGLNYRFGGEHFTSSPAPMTRSCGTCNWTGFYAGLNEATRIGNERAHELVTLAPATVGGALTNPVTDVSHTDSPLALMIGGQIGYNWQIRSLLLGLEGDLNWSGQRDTFSNSNFIASTVTVAPTTIGLTSSQKLDWLATARGRVGWTENGFLWYLTGGLAWGHIRSDYTFQANQLAGAPAVFPTAPFTASATSTKTGWTLGGGLESTLTWLGLSDRWSSKFEYLYVDLGSINNNYTIPLTTGAGSYTYTSSRQIHDHIVRFGINYRFGG